jgi:hypothetical protein
MCAKELFSFKMILETSTAYSELHTYISLPSNCQTFVSNSPAHSCCSPLPLDAVNLVNTEPLTAEQRASGKRIYTDQHSRISIYTKCKAFRQRRDIFKIKISVFLFYFLLGATVEGVCASFQDG